MVRVKPDIKLEWNEEFFQGAQVYDGRNRNLSYGYREIKADEMQSASNLSISSLCLDDLCRLSVSLDVVVSFSSPLFVLGRLGLGWGSVSCSAHLWCIRIGRFRGPDLGDFGVAVNVVSRFCQ
jgi:hypothetical protein